MLLLERLQPSRTFAKSSAAKVGEATDAYAPRAKEREAEENGADDRERPGPPRPLARSGPVRDRAALRGEIIAEMTPRDAPPQLTRVHLFPFGVVARGGAEHRVAVLLLETLSGQKLRLGARDVDPETFARAFEEQVGRPDDELREATRRAYREHFEGRSPRGSGGARRPPGRQQVAR